MKQIGISSPRAISVVSRDEIIKAQHKEMVMNRCSRRLIVILLLLSSGASFAGQSFWQSVTPKTKLLSDQATSIQFSDEITSIRYFDANEQALRDFLALVPHELSGDDSYTILLPMPDGSQTRYSIVESPIMEAGLAAQFPEIKTFKVRGIDDPGASGRVDISQKGFRAMLFTLQGRVFIDPESSNLFSNRYMSRVAGAEFAGEAFQCSAGQLVENQSIFPLSANRIANLTASRIPGSLLEYRLAVSATVQYVNAVGGTRALALFEIMTAINRVNLIYERDLGIRLRLINNNNLLIDDTGLVNPNFYDANGNELSGIGFFDQNGLFVNGLIDENPIWIDATIGSGSYDIGHIFSTGGGGVAQLQAVCGADKARGVTGLPNPTGDIFYIDFVAHEIGHQFGAEHSFNGTTGSCGSNRSLFATTFEPGSGSTIMAYAGICGAENIQNTADATFHAGSISQINNFVGGAGSCNFPAVISPFPNTDPTANAGIDRIIPINTSFRLQGSGADADLPADTLSYQWDQMDAGTATSATTLGDDFGDNALFRSYLPQPTGDRDFPALGTQVTDGPIDLSEALPCTPRIINFRLTVRDNKSGLAADDVKITVDGNSGPFRVTSFNTAQTIFITSPLIFNWDVANTNTGAVSCANVDIDLLTFSADHKTYAVTQLLSNVSNNGNQIVKLPDKSNSNARFRVSCNGNIFYDISDADLIIRNSGGAGAGTFVTTGNTTFFNTNGQVFATSGTCDGSPKVIEIGIGEIDGRWILFLLSLWVCPRLTRSHS